MADRLDPSQGADSRQSDVRLAAILFQRSIGAFTYVCQCFGVKFSYGLAGYSRKITAPSSTETSIQVKPCK